MRPRAAPTLLAALAAAAPARLVKKLDLSPRVAETWSWSDGSVTTESGETVTFAAALLRSADQVRCSCLLSPRCFHVLAAVAALEVDAGEEPNDAAPVAAADPAALPRLVPVTPEQRAIGVRARAVLRDWLAAGASGAGAVLQGELLRVAHEARLEGAHRLSAAALRVVRGARDLREERAEFRSDALMDALLELGVTAHRLATHHEASIDVLGVARREYEDRGSLRLQGLCCEPVISRDGFAGVTSYVCDDRGVVYTVSDVIPADPSRARGAYDLSVVMGDTSLSHRELCRGGLFVQDATASVDLRLGAGKRVKAVRAASRAGEGAAGPGALFARPFAEQLDRVFAAFAPDAALRPKSASLVFVRAALLGAEGPGVAAAVGDRVLRLAAADDHPSLPYRENLRLLAELAGRELLVIGHVMPHLPRTILTVAVGVVPGQDALALPDSMNGWLNLGLDVLSRNQLVAKALRRAPIDPPASIDPLAPLRRRLVALALHGTGAIPVEGAAKIDVDRRALRAAIMPAAAGALGALAEACFGARRRGERPERLFEAFLAAATYERAATARLQRATFLG